MTLTTLIIALLLFWITVTAILWIGKHQLFSKTWNEPYIKEKVLLIESDDWGPGGDFHADRLKRLSATLEAFKDSLGRPAVLTGDMVLSVPDLTEATSTPDQPVRRNKLDETFPAVHQSFLDAMKQGVFVPQLHGLEHLYGEGLKKLAIEKDPRIQIAAQTENWWDWEALDSPLQGHYVDGTSLPTRTHDTATQKTIVEQATQLFEQCFGFATSSTVAPCYLWVDDTEKAWSDKNINIIQTAGYRCPGRREDGSYIQDRQETRPGDTNELGQVYLVRNAMYEPVDGRTEPDCIKQVDQAFNQASPATISTHRYNYTRTEEECEMSLKGLQIILEYVTQYPELRFASSPELGQWFIDEKNLINPADKSEWPALTAVTGINKTGPFFTRLWHRHQKIRFITMVTGLFIPAWLLGKIFRP